MPSGELGSSPHVSTQPQKFHLMQMHCRIQANSIRTRSENHTVMAPCFARLFSAAMAKSKHRPNNLKILYVKMKPRNYGIHATELVGGDSYTSYSPYIFNIFPIAICIHLLCVCLRSCWIRGQRIHPAISARSPDWRTPEEPWPESWQTAAQGLKNGVTKTIRSWDKTCWDPKNYEIHH